MSSVLRPRGPQKPSVYWRRRAVALLLVLVIPLALGLLLFGGGSDEPSAEASPAPSPEPTPSATATQPDDEPSAEPEPSPSPSTSGPPSPPVCSDSDIEVRAATDRESYPPGANPQITLTIANASEGDCLRDIGSGANEIIVSSGGFHVWSSDDCDPSQAGNEQLLPAGAEAQVTLTWERKLSAPGCSGEATAAQPGTYQVQVRNGDVRSEELRIVLQ